MATITLTATPEPGYTPPRMKLVVTATGTPTVSSLTIIRSNPSGRTYPVRTADAGPVVLSAGSATIYDYEVPYGQQVTFTTDQAGGPSVTATLDVASPWLVHPGAPSRSVPLVLRAGSNEEEEWAIEQGVFQVLGRETPVVVTGGARSAATSTLVAETSTETERAALKQLLSDGFPLLLTVPPAADLGIDSAYIAIGSVKQRRPSDIGSDQIRDIEMPYQVVDRPAGGTQAAITWADGASKYTTWAAAVAAGVKTWAQLAAPTT